LASRAQAHPRARAPARPGRWLQHERPRHLPTPIVGGSSDPDTIHIQVIVKNGATLEFSKVLALNIGI